MELEQKIQDDLKAAMLAKDPARVEALRGMKAVLLLLKTSPEGLTEASAIKALMKEAKKRREAAEIFTQQDRKDLADVEIFQAGVFESYLPKMMSEDEVRAELQKIIAGLGASSPADMGKVMGAATKQLAGKADGKMISTIVKDLLSKG